MKQSKDLIPSWDNDIADPALDLAEKDDLQESADLDEMELTEAASTPEEVEGFSATDPFGLYLQQMGSIPMLNRQQELELTARLERLKRRYRRAALCSAPVLAHVI